MDGETNQTAAVTEPTAADSAGQKPESTDGAAASTPQQTPDWYKAIPEDAPEEDLEKHPRLASLIDRKAQAFADRVKLKDREAIKADVHRELSEEAFRQKWQSMTPQQRVQYRIQQEESDMLIGNAIKDWWPAQAKAVKEKVAELKEKDMEAFNKVFQDHPHSWGDTMAAFIDEISTMRSEAAHAHFVKHELPKLVEAEVKDRIARTIAGGDKPDLRSGGAGSSPSDDEAVKAYARGDTDTVNGKRGMDWLNAVLKS